MYSRVFLLLLGAAFLSHQVLAQDEIFVAELMVESNITLDSATLLAILSTADIMQVDDLAGTTHDVNVMDSSLIAECLVVGPSISCNCSEGLTWANDVCYAHSCCRPETCFEDVVSFSPLCIPKISVRLNGSVSLSLGTWDDAKTLTLQTELEKLNGFEGINITGQREGATIADFEADVSVAFETSRLQTYLSNLEAALSAIILVDSTGLVEFEGPESTVCYLAVPTMKCSFPELSDSMIWTLSRPFEYFQLNTGSVVEMHGSCATVEFPSCDSITLHEVTGLWEGMYECRFTRGSVTHTARSYLKVALLPDEITVTINPLTVDCFQLTPADSLTVIATATILKSPEEFEVKAFYREEDKGVVEPQFDVDDVYQYYTVEVSISCTTSPDAHYVEFIFKNQLEQTKTARVDIPTVYVGAPFCEAEILNDQEWPKTPRDDTVINRTCEPGRTGYKMRTCAGGDWLPVHSNCVDEELAVVLGAAENFRKGLGATQAVAMDIFSGLANKSNNPLSETEDDMADLSASIDVLNVMADASLNVVLEEEVLPDLVDAASTMLNQSWVVNTSVKHDMSSNYLVSLEGLVKHIHVNTSSGLNSQNLDLKFCSEVVCNLTVFDISVNLNRTTGTVKTVAVKNIMDKLRNTYRNSEPTSLLLSATLVGNNDSSIYINLNFPTEKHPETNPNCVFFNTTIKDFSDEGCYSVTAEENRTHCICNHLTSFSVLMSKNADVLPFLDEITYVGLGVSLCSLVVLLIIEYLVWAAVVKSNLALFRHTSLVNISVCLLLANCCFLASSFPDKISETMCLSFTLLKHFFYLAMFCWMLCLSVMLVHQLIFVFSPLRKRVFMFLSSIVGYIVPILMVGSSFVYYKYTDQPYHKKETCWLTFNGLLDGSLHAFILPMGAIVFTNMFSMGVVIITLVKTSIPEGGNADKETAKSVLKVVIFLTPVFGVTWAFGFIMLLLDDDSPMRPFFVYAFTILNSFQGLFILLTACFAEQKVREELFKLIVGSDGDAKKNLNAGSKDK